MTNVMLGVPSRDEWKADFSMSVLAMMNFSRSFANVTTTNRKSSQITANRNKIVSDTIKSGADWLLMLDADMQFPPDTLYRLLNKKEKIVGASYIRRAEPYDSLGKPLDVQSPFEDMIEMDWLPTGCMLVHISVFLSIEWPWFAETYNRFDAFDGEVGGEDHYFCQLVRKHGHKVWCDMDLSYDMGHIGQRTLKMRKAA